MVRRKAIGTQRRSLSAALGLLLVGCGGGGTGAVGAAPEVGWQRVVTPFEVVDSTGRAYEHPFLGGFDVPRPQLIDIDADKDPDLFVQERSNQLMFLENVGDASNASFVWRTDRFRGLDISEWYRFVDMDQDGDQDLLAEEPFSYIRFYRNVGSPAEPRFELAVDTLRTVGGEPLLSDRQNIPNATDIDCDGLTDLFVGRLAGTVTRYEAVEARADEPRFRLVSERFGDIEIVANLVGTRHGANTMDFADYDGDGDVDLFWGDFFEAGLLLLENTGTCQNPEITNDPVPFPPDDPVQTTGYNAPTVADLNADGRPDMLIGVLGGAYNPTLSARANLYHLRHTADGFDVVTRRYLEQMDVGSESSPTFLDDDGDGDLDLLVGAKIDPTVPGTGRVYRFENIGTVERPALRWAGALSMSGSYHYAPEGGDLDGDGDVDLLLGTWNDEVLFYANTGGGERWRLEAEPLVELTRGSHSTPALGDVDGDSDLDLFVGESSGAVNFFRNVGSPAEAEFELVSDTWNDLDFGRRSHPELVDLDEDGDPDLVVGNEDGDLTYFANDGGRFSEIEEPLPTWPFAAPAFVDLDGDGVLELVVGGLSGGLAFFRQ